MKISTRSLVGILLCSLLTLVENQSASAASLYFDNSMAPGGSGTWNSTSSWSTHTVPTSADSVYFSTSSSSSESYVIDIGSGATANYLNNFGSGTGAYRLTLTGDGTFTVGNISMNYAGDRAITLSCNVAALTGGIISLQTVPSATINFSSGYTVTGGITITGGGTVNLNSDLNAGSAASALDVRAGTVNWNVGTFTSTSTGGAVLKISGRYGAATVNLSKSFDSNGGISLGQSGSNTQLALYGVVNGVTVADNITTIAAGTGGAAINTITLGANDAAATSGSQTTVTFTGNYTATDTNARTHNFYAAANNNAIFSGVIAGSGAGSLFKKTGAGTVTFSGASANTYSSAVSMEVAEGKLLLQKTSGVAVTSSTVTVDSGATLQLGASSQINTASALYIGGGTFDLQSFNQTLASVQLTNNGTISGSDGTLTAASAYDLQSGAVSAKLAGAVALNKTTSGTVTLTGANTYSGATTVTAGELKVNGSLAASSAVSVTGATLSGNGTVGGAVTVSSGTVNGSGLSMGATTLSGSSTLSGYNTASSVTVDSGTTALTGTTQSTGTLIVSAGATLNANGTIAGSANVRGLLKGNSTVTGNLSLTSGTLSSGNSSGVTTVDGNFVVDAGSKLVAEVTGAVAGTSYDQVRVSGNIALAGVLDLTTLSGLTQGTTITLIDNAGTGTTTGYFSTILTSDSTYSATSNADFSFTVDSTQYLLSYNTSNSGSNFSDVTLTVIPEPSTWAMLLGGIGALAFGQRLRRRASR